MPNIIVEATDNLGKDTLINNLIVNLGHHIVHHYQKPIITIPDRSRCLNSMEAQQVSQYSSFDLGFRQLMTGIPTIYNRFHLGECVYAPMYRKYSGDYVFDLEEKYLMSYQVMHNTILVLLTTSDFSFITDDGLSFDPTKQEEEQELFKKAFNRSKFENKIMVDVHDGKGNFKSPHHICQEVLSLYDKIYFIPTRR